MLANADWPLTSSTWSQSINLTQKLGVSCPLSVEQSANLIDIWHLCGTFVILLCLCLYSLLLLVVVYLRTFPKTNNRHGYPHTRTHTHTLVHWQSSMSSLSRRQQTIFDISTFINQNGNYGEAHTHTHTYTCGIHKCTIYTCICVRNNCGKCGKGCAVLRQVQAGRFDWPINCSILLSARE